MLGWMLVGVSAVLTLPQLMIDRPSQAAVVLGLVLGLLGGLRVSDERRSR